MQPTPIPTPPATVPLHDQLATVLKKVLGDARLRAHPFLRIWQEKHPDVAVEDLCKYCCEHNDPDKLLLAIARVSAKAWQQISLAGAPADDGLIVDLCCHMSLVGFAGVILKEQWACPALEDGITSVDMAIKEAAAITAAVWLNVGLKIELASSTEGGRIEVVNLISDQAESQFNAKTLERSIEDEIIVRARRHAFPNEIDNGPRKRLRQQYLRQALEDLEAESGAGLIVGLGDVHKRSFIDGALQKRLMEQWGVKMFFYGRNGDGTDAAASEDLQSLEETLITHLTEVMRSGVAIAPASLPVGGGNSSGNRVKIFISYARVDDKHRKYVVEHLRVLDRLGFIELWDDQQIEAGADWEAVIDQRMRSCKLAVLLISPAFLGSAFIASKEVPLLLDRHRREGMELMPVLIRNAHWEDIDWLKRLQMRPTGGKPLYGEQAKRDTQLREIAGEISRICQR